MKQRGKMLEKKGIAWTNHALSEEYQRAHI